MAGSTAGNGRLLEGVRIIESAMLGPGAVGMNLADLGADVVKVEPPGGDPIRRQPPFKDEVPNLETATAHLHLSHLSLVDLHAPSSSSGYPGKFCNSRDIPL